MSMEISDEAKTINHNEANSGEAMSAEPQRSGYDVILGKGLEELGLAPEGAPKTVEFNIESLKRTYSLSIKQSKAMTTWGAAITFYLEIGSPPKTISVKISKNNYVKISCEINGQPVTTWDSFSGNNKIVNINRINNHSAFSLVMAAWFHEEKSPYVTQDVFSQELSKYRLYYNANDKSWSHLSWEDDDSVVVDTYQALPEDVVFENGPPDVEFYKSVAAFFLNLIIRRAVLSDIFGLQENVTFLTGFGQTRDKADSYIPVREVDLSSANLDLGHLKLEDVTVELACATLNAGQNVIFTGPPGTGKTEFAQALAFRATGEKPILATASPAWTTDELIGRYMPSIKDGRTLEFVPGFFLQAITNSKWLIIDEMNRADIDSCLGELFSILSGHEVTLPFQEAVESGKDQKEARPIRIIPPNAGDEKLSDKYVNYRVPKNFRIICTMNDSDASRLHQLSFALQRRFNIIHVEAPPAPIVEKIITTQISKLLDRVGKQERRLLKAIGKEAQKDIYTRMTSLFASETGPDLVTLRVVGIAQVLDILILIIESITVGKGSTADSGMSKGGQGGQSYVATCCAMGVVAKVYPQLKSFVGGRRTDDLKSAINIINSTFAGVTMHSVKKGEDGKLAITDTENRIQEYLKKEYDRMFKDESDVYLWDNLVTSGEQK